MLQQAQALNINIDITIMQATFTVMLNSLILLKTIHRLHMSEGRRQLATAHAHLGDTYNQENSHNTT